MRLFLILLASPICLLFLWRIARWGRPWYSPFWEMDFCLSDSHEVWYHIRHSTEPDRWCFQNRYESGSIRHRFALTATIIPILPMLRLCLWIAVLIDSIVFLILRMTLLSIIGILEGIAYAAYLLGRGIGIVVVAQFRYRALKERVEVLTRTVERLEKDLKLLHKMDQWAGVLRYPPVRFSAEHLHRLKPLYAAELLLELYTSGDLTPEEKLLFQDFLLKIDEEIRGYLYNLAASSERLDKFSVIKKLCCTEEVVA